MAERSKSLKSLPAKLSRISSWPLLVIVSVQQLILWSTLGRQSSWFDEGFTAFALRLGWIDMYERLIYDVHPPLYYFVLKAWAQVFGGDIYSLRAFSVVCSGALAIICWFIAKRTFKSRSTIIAATAAAALGIFTIRYGVEARMYSFTAVIIALSTLVLMQAQDKPSRMRWFAYSLLVAAGFMTQYFAIFAFAGHGIWMLVMNWPKYHTSGGVFGFFQGIARFIIKNPWPRWCLLSVIMVSWWIPYGLAQFTDIQGGFWIEGLKPWTPISLFGSLLTLNLVQGGFWDRSADWPHVLFAILAMALLGWWWLRAKQNDSTKLLALVFFTPAAIMLGLSFVGESIFYPRYFSNYSWAIYMLFGSAILWLLRRQKAMWMKAVIVGLVAIVAGFSTYRYMVFGEFNSAKIDGRYDDLAAYIQDNASGDRFVTSSSVHLYSLNAHDPEIDMVMVDGDRWGERGGLALVNGSSYVFDDVKSAAAGNYQVWLVQVGDDFLTEDLAPLGERIQFGPGLYIQPYEVR